MTASTLLSSVAMGIGATLLIDAWAWALRRGFAIPSLDYCLLGRWALHVPRGTVMHAHIAKAEPVRRECVAGWIMHFGVGIGFAVAFAFLAPTDWLSRPTLAPALLFGIATVVTPFFVLQPALGLGIASSRTPHPARARVKSLATHTVFGLGLYGSAWLLAHVR